MKYCKKSLTVSQIQALDRWAIEKIGIPSLALMENAGRGVAQEIYKNGGDGFVAARYLYNWGFKPRIYLIGKPSQLKPDALTNYRVAQNLKLAVKPINGLSLIFKKSIQSADLIVDAIFGVGLTRTIQEPYYSIIQSINAQKAYIIAVDIPSGLDGTTGKIYDICIKANMTVTISYPKKGFFKNQGSVYTGLQKTIDIGIT